REKFLPVSVTVVGDPLVPETTVPLMVPRPAEGSTARPTLPVTFNVLFKVMFLFVTLKLPPTLPPVNVLVPVPVDCRTLPVVFTVPLKVALLLLLTVRLA